MRLAVKRTAERVLCVTGIARVVRAAHSTHTVILAYHNIVPDGDLVRGELSLHLPQREFARQLDLLERTHQVVSLTAVGQPHAGGRPRAVITFDDACQGALTAGLSELARREMPATFFVAPAFLEGKSYWWDALAAGSNGELSPELRDHALDQLQGKDGAVRAWASQRALTVYSVPAHQCGASQTQLAHAAATPGITLASHTWSHPNLERLAGAEMKEELERPLAWLRERFTSVLPWLSYPYGRYSAAAQRAAAEAGYEGALLIQGGLTPGKGVQHLAIPRINVPARLSLDGFELRTAGVLR